MRRKWLLAVALGVAAIGIFSGVMLSATATAADSETIYCVNGVTSNLIDPLVQISATSESAGSGTWDMSPGWADAILSVSPSGVFYVGYITEGADWYWDTIPDYFEPGYSTNIISLGSCRSAPAVVVPSHVGVCKYLMRGDGTMGMFQEITVAEWNNPDGQYYDAVAANWVEGLGLTCDNPVALGYKPAGYNVAWGGVPDPGHDANGVRGSGFNNIYPYFTK